MNILLFLHTAAFILNFYLAYYIFIKDPRAELNRSSSTLLLCFALWNFCEIFTRNSNLSYETSTLFLRISAFAWMLGPSVFFTSILFFTERKYITKYKFYYPLLLILPLVFIHKQWDGNDFITLVRHARFGWINKWHNSVWTYLFYPYIVFLFIAAFYIILKFRQMTYKKIKKKQATVIFITSLASITLAALINIVFPQVGITSVPPVGDILLLIWSLGLVYSMIKYKFFEISPAAAANEIITTMPDSLILLNRTGNITTVNKQTVNLLGYEEKELVGQPVSILFGAGDSVSTLFGRIINDDDFRNEDLFFKTRGGQNIPVSFSRSVLKDANGNTIGIVCVATDLTEYRNVEKVLKESRQYYRALVETSPDIIFNISVDGRINGLNPAFEKLTGWSIDEWTGKSFLSVIHPDDRPIFTAIAKRAMNGEPTPPYEIRIISHCGEYTHMETIITPEYREGNLAGIFGFAHNITERKKNEERLAHLAYHDFLTGLPNRKSFYINLSDQISQAKRGGHTGAVLYIDIDNFKLVNDSSGHETGDTLLRGISTRLSNSVRTSDKVYRIGGDEFAMILSHIAHDGDAGIIAQKIQQSFQTPFTIAKNSIYVSSSMGISIFPRDADDPETLLRYADNAMYRAKDLGKNNYQFYNEEINLMAHERLSLRNNLIDAIENEKLNIYYQPIIRGTEILGTEAILRWFHPEEGTIPPRQFIPIAEEFGLINKIGEWVLLSACKKNREWHDKGYDNLYISVNISPEQFKRSTLIDSVKKALSMSGLAPEFLNLEITESCIIEDPESSIKIMKELRDMGIKISIDNFGTGFSSLISIKKFPVNSLKIDRNFIANIINDLKDQAIVKATIEMAKGLMLDTVVEGIETKEQLEFMGNMNCDIFQGFYFSKPVTCEEMEDLLKKGL